MDLKWFDPKEFLKKHPNHGAASWYRFEEELQRACPPPEVFLPEVCTDPIDQIVRQVLRTPSGAMVILFWNWTYLSDACVPSHILRKIIQEQLKEDE